MYSMSRPSPVNKNDFFLIFMLFNKNAYHRRKHGSQRHELLKDNLTELNRIQKSIYADTNPILCSNA